jgi:hypothetical protein
MAWYAYCVTEKQAFPALLRHRKPVPLETVTGIEGNQVFLYPANDLAVVVSEHVPSQVSSSQNAKDHARVIADCFKTATVLPFRFGTVFANDELLRRSVRANQRQFLSNIAALHGKSEMHMKLTLEDCCREQIREAFTAVGSRGRTYLSDLRESAVRQRERQVRGRSLSTQLNRMFSPLAEEITCRRLESGKMQLDVSHLIPSRLVERYGNKFQMVREQMRDCQLQLSGPWPPYHFVHSLTRPVTGPVTSIAAQSSALSA